MPADLPYLTMADTRTVYIFPPESGGLAPDLDPDTNPAIAAFCDLIADIIMGTLAPETTHEAEAEAQRA